LYVKSRFGSGDVDNSRAALAMKSIGAEWKSLSAAQKQVREICCDMQRPHSQSDWKMSLTSSQ